MDELEEQAKKFLSQRIGQIREEHRNLSHAERKEQMKTLDRILFSLADGDREWLDAHITDDLLVTLDECEALYLAGFKDGLRLLKLISLD